MFNWASEKFMYSTLQRILQKWASSQPSQTRNMKAPLSNDLQTFMKVMSDALCPEDDNFVTNSNGKSQELQNQLVAKMMNLYPYSNSKEGFFQFSQLKIPHSL
jgi:hypothetical protein